MPEDITTAAIVAAVGLIGAFTTYIVARLNFNREQRETNLRLEAQGRQFDIDRERIMTEMFPQMQREIAELHRQLDQERHARLSSDHRHALERIELKGEIEALTRRVEKLSEELEKQQKVNELLEKQNRDLQRQNAALEQKLTACLDDAVRTSAVTKAVDPDQESESENKENN